MPGRKAGDDPGPDRAKALDGFGRYAGPAMLILASLADGAKHGYALTKDIESFAGVRLAPGTLYEALARLQAQGLIEPVESHDRRAAPRDGTGPGNLFHAGAIDVAGLVVMTLALAVARQAARQARAGAR